MAQSEQRSAKPYWVALSVGMVLAVALPITYLTLTPLLSPPAEPGDISSPTLAKVLNESIDTAVADLDPKTWPGLIPEAAANSQVFLREVAEVVARCSKGPLEPNQKYNRMLLHLVGVDGSRYEPITSRGCGEDSLIFRATFKDGRIAEVFTDGRERRYSVEEVKGLVNIREFGKRLISSDKTRHPERYYRAAPPQPPPRDVSKDWE
ncbi:MULTISPECIES: hypothetical protein [Corallococcus]|uniref:hypothetical protein n=1 Tax=Corallococcus TaxID=83461 RepID=UPI001F26A251|nr:MULTISPECIES: hypothetical protein [Corallococcus]